MDNQETREVTTTYADGSTVTMTIDRKTGALLDYNATPPPPRTTGAGLQGLAKRVETLEQSRTSDIADFVRKAEIFSEEHTTILPELLPDPEIKWLKGKGRPDNPETTEGVIQGDEAECTRYLSTDGAGTGAWEWEKRGGVWHVVRGDTGWREIENPQKYFGKIRLRRVDDRISLEFGGGKWDYFGTVRLSQSAKDPNKENDINAYRIELHRLSEGFRSCTNAINQIFDDETNAQVGMVLVGGVKDNLGMVDLRFAMTVNRENNFNSLRIGIVTFPTVDRWPETLGGVASESCPI